MKGKSEGQNGTSSTSKKIAEKVGVSYKESLASKPAVAVDVAPPARDRL